jgi:replicative DNA helicase
MNARANLTEAEVFGQPSEVSLLRIPPHSIEAESSVLGGLLLDGGGASWDRVADILTHEDFYRYEHILIFEAIGMLANANRSADVVTVYAKLQGMKGGTDVDLLYLNSLAQFVPSAANIRRYAELVREKSLLRRLVAASDQIATSAFNPGLKTVAEVVDDAENLIFQIGDQRKDDDWHDTSDSVVRFLDRIQNHAEQEDFVPTGITELDDKLDGGMREGEVYVIAARPRMGKTALAITILEHVALNEGHPVALMSMEMGEAQVTRRRMSSVGHIPLHKLKRPERLNDSDWASLTETVEKMRQVRFYVSDKGALSLNQIRARARGLKRKQGLRVLAIDYIGLMDTDPKESRAAAIGRISRGIKALAKELNITILLLSQLNRGIEGRVNKRPMLSDIRESGDIEQDADVILFVHRDYADNPDLPIEWKYYGELIIAKHRDGEAGGVIGVGYDGPQVRFYNWTGDKPSSLAKVQAEAPAKATRKANPL